MRLGVYMYVCMQVSETILFFVSFDVIPLSEYLTQLWAILPRTLQKGLNTSRSLYLHIAMK